MIAPDLLDLLENLVDVMTRGASKSRLRRSCKGRTQSAEARTHQGHALSPHTVGRLVNDAGYIPKRKRQTVEGAVHPDPNTQFLHISQAVGSFRDRRQPAISVDTKKREPVGAFKKGGREWRLTGMPEGIKV